MATFTPRELELLTIAFQCLKEKPNVRLTHLTYHAPPLINSPIQIDYELMASKAGLKGVKSARDSFGPLYNKIVSGQKISAAANGEGGEQSALTSPPKKKATPSKRKAGMLSLTFVGVVRGTSAGFGISRRGRGRRLFSD